MLQNSLNGIPFVPTSQPRQDIQADLRYIMS
jgi:hypothetical protein